MKIATAPTRLSRQWRTQEISWPEFVGKLRQTKRTGETMAEYRRMSHDQRSARKDVGGFVGGALASGRRTAGGVEERWLVTLDADRGEGDEWDDFTCLYDYEAVAYPTHSNTPESARWRFVLPLSRAVTPEEYVAVARMVATWFGIDSMDPTTYQPERLMYWPSSPEDAPYELKEHHGAWLDPDEVLAEYGPGGAWRDESLWPMGKDEVEIVRRNGQQQGNPLEKPGIVGMFCRYCNIHEAIERYLSDKYEPCDGMTDVAGYPTRYTYALGSTYAGAVVYDGGNFLYSNHATDPCGGKLCNAFDLVRLHLFGEQDVGKTEKDVTRLPSYKAMCEWVADDPGYKQYLIAEMFGDMGELNGGYETGAVVHIDPETNEVVEMEVLDEEDEDWAQELGLDINRKTGKLEAKVSSLEAIISRAPVLRNKIAYNEWTDRVVLLGPVPWRRELRPGEKWGSVSWTEMDDAGLRMFIEDVCGIDNVRKITDAFNLVCKSTLYHPVREYLRGLDGQWDGFERLDTMLIRYMGADDTPYVRAVTRKWMVAAVKRIMEPGCKFDSVLVLQGPQGIGKSNLGQVLSRGWFSDSVPTLGVDKRAYEALRGKWIIEIAEMASAKRSEQEAQKAFLTATVDSYRPPYAALIRDFPRQCVFYATTNEGEPLRDHTGGRRYWPVRCKGVDQGYPIGFELPNEVDQLWAEALARYHAGETLYIRDAVLEAEAKEEQEMMTVEDSDFELVREYLERLWPEDWATRTLEFRQAVAQGENDSYLLEGVELTVKRDVICITQIKEELYGVAWNEQHKNDKLSRILPGVMNRMPGWEKGGRQSVPVYGQQRVYIRVTKLDS